MANKALVLGAATIGGVMVYSGIAGVSVMDVLAGRASLKDVDPKGGKGFDLASALRTMKQGAASTLVPPSAILGEGPSKKCALNAVEWSAAVAKRHGVDVISSHRPGSTTSSGNLSNHAGNDCGRAARDLSNTNNAAGSPEQEAACRDIMRGFGRSFPRRGEIIDNFRWGELEVEIIYRTPKYGGHIGHIHVGAHQ